MGCGSCERTNGKENYVGNNEGTNKTRNGVKSVIWQHHEEKYTTVAQAEAPSSKKTIACYYPGEVYGHGQVIELKEETASLEGRQDNFNYCG